MLSVSIRNTYSSLPNLHAHIIITATEEVMIMTPTISRRRKRRRRIKTRDLSVTFDSSKATDPVKATGQLEDNLCYK
jgi:hypothetical protein